MSRPTCQLANRTFADILKRDVPQCYLCGKKINSIEDLVEPCIDAVFPLLFVATNISGNRHTACWIELNDSFEYFAVPSGTAVSDPHSEDGAPPTDFKQQENNTKEEQ